MKTPQLVRDYCELVGARGRREATSCSRVVGEYVETVHRSSDGKLVTTTVFLVPNIHSIRICGDGGNVIG